MQLKQPNTTQTQDPIPKPILFRPKLRKCESANGKLISWGFDRPRQKTGAPNIANGGNESEKDSLISRQTLDFLMFIGMKMLKGRDNVFCKGFFLHWFGFRFRVIVRVKKIRINSIGCHLCHGLFFTLWKKNKYK